MELRLVQKWMYLPVFFNETRVVKRKQNRYDISVCLLWIFLVWLPGISGKPPQVCACVPIAKLVVTKSEPFCL
jgi:hypothetical protein